MTQIISTLLILAGISTGMVVSNEFFSQSLGALRVFTASQGGTGIGSATAGDVGECIKVLDDSPFTYELGTCGGASSSAFEVATTTDIALSEVAYITKTSGRTTLGSVATGTISVPTGLTVTANRYALGGSTAIGLDTGYVIPQATQLFGKAWELTTNVFSQSALAPTTTQNIHVSGTGTSTFAGGLEAWRQIASPYFHATSSTATSTFAGGGLFNTLRSVLAPTFDALTSALLLTDASGNTGEYAGTTCTNQFVRALSALGVATCASVDVTADITGVLPIANGGTNNSSTYTAGSVIFSNGTSLTQDNANFFWDDTNNHLGIGSTTPWAKLAVNPVAGDVNQFVVGSSTATSFIINSAGNVGAGGTSDPVAPFVLSNQNGISSELFTSDKFLFAYEGTAPGFSGIAASDSSALHRVVFKGTRARGTLAAPTVPSSGDSVFTMLGAIYDGDQTLATAGVDFIVDGSVSNNVAPQRIEFLTNTTNSRTTRLRINGDGTIDMNAAAATTDRSTLCISAVSLGTVTSDAAGNNCDTSSARFKNTITPLEVDGLAIVNQLEPTSFYRNNTDKLRSDGRKEWDFIAEEVAKIEPNLALFEEDGKTPFSIDRDAVTLVIVDAIKQLTQWNTRQDSRLDVLEARLNEVEKELATLKRMCLL